MNKLIIKAIKITSKEVNEVSKMTMDMSDNLHDIALFLDENKETLQNKSEVTTEESIVLMDACVLSFNKINEKFYTIKEWLEAMDEFK